MNKQPVLKDKPDPYVSDPNEPTPEQEAWEDATWD